MRGQNVDRGEHSGACERSRQQAWSVGLGQYERPKRRQGRAFWCLWANEQADLELRIGSVWEAKTSTGASILVHMGAHSADLEPRIGSV